MLSITSKGANSILLVSIHHFEYAIREANYSIRLDRFFTCVFGLQFYAMKQIITIKKLTIMLRLFSIIMLFTTLLQVNTWAQAPNQINYQGVAVNSVGTPIINQNIALRLTVHQNTANGTILYSESRNTSTDETGLFNIQIGSTGASAVLGSWSNINWENGAKFLEIEMDATAGTNFIDMGTQQLVSVPYAQFSNVSGGLTPTATIAPNQITNGGATTNQVLKYDGTHWVAGDDVSAFSLPYLGNSPSFGQLFRINSTAANGSALWGNATGSNSAAVHGASSGSNGVGVQGYGTGVNGIGVEGYTYDPSGTGVYGWNSNGGTGVKGEATSQNVGISGVYGLNNGNGGCGVLGESNGANSFGVRGLSTSGVGLYGYSSTNRGVFASTLSGTALYGYSFTGYGLESNGKVKLYGGNMNPSDGAVLTSDASGNATWKPRKVAFTSQFTASNLPWSSGSYFYLTGLNETYDVGSDFNPTSAATDANTFIAPVSGLYSFQARAEIYILSSVYNVEYIDLAFVINGVNSFDHIGSGSWSNTALSSGSVEGTQLIHLNAGDKVKVRVKMVSENNTSGTMASSGFEGHLIFAD